MLDFNRGTIGGTAPVAGASTGSKRDLPKANGWLNFGYTVVIAGAAEGETEERFVSLPVGIPVDTMEPLAINSRNQQYAQFQSARNDLLAQLKAALATMQPGEEKIVALDPQTGLSVQLRRVNDPAAVPAADASNPFAIKLGL